MEPIRQESGDAVGVDEFGAGSGGSVVCDPVENVAVDRSRFEELVKIEKLFRTTSITPLQLKQTVQDGINSGYYALMSEFAALSYKVGDISYHDPQALLVALRASCGFRSLKNVAKVKIVCVRVCVYIYILRFLHSFFCQIICFFLKLLIPSFLLISRSFY